MLGILLSTSLVFITTSIDYLFLLFLAFSQAKTNSETNQVMLGFYLGTLSLILISLILSYLVSFIPQDWVIGLLGLLSIMLGIRHIITNNDKHTQSMKTHLSGANVHFVWPIYFITIASGGDNIGIYIPYFLSLTPLGIIFSIILILLLTGCLLYFSLYLARIQYLSKRFNRYEAVIVPLVYFALGIYILIDNGTLRYLLDII